MKKREELGPKLPEEEAEDLEQEEKQGIAKRAGRAIVLLVVLLFAAVMFITYFVELKFGKTAGTISLLVITLAVAFGLYRKEIAEKLKRKKQDGMK